MYWRNSKWITKVYDACKPIKLPEGLLVSHDFDTPVEYIKESIYQQTCYEDAVPMLNTNIGMVMNTFSKALPVVRSSWNEFTQHGDKGSFAYSMVPIIYSISISAVITWFLTLFVFTNYTIKPSLLMKSSTFLSSVFLLITVIKSIVVSHQQQRKGYLHGAMLLDSINSDVALNIIDLLVVILLQINQVQVIMRIFSRQYDKRLTFFVGVIASITSQVIWAVTKFHHFRDEEEAGDILPAFIYLVRIAMAVCYAALISVFQLSKINYIIANRDIWLLSLLTIIFIYSPVAFFIADVANAWVYELSEIFSVVTYVICVVIPWEWCNKFNMIMKKKEKEGVLGRKFYEDELYELDRFELFMEQDDDPHNRGTSNSHQQQGHQTSGSAAPSVPQTSTESGLSQKETPVMYENSTSTNKLINSLRFAKSAFLDLTDVIIATGLAIPRSVSVSTPSTSSSNNGPHETYNDAHRRTNYQSVPNGEDYQPHVDTEVSPRSTNNVRNINSNRRHDVFVYSRREVIINVSDDEDN